MIDLKNTLKEMIEETNDIIYVLEVVPSFKFSYINNAIYNIIGYNPNELINNSEKIFELIHKEDLNYLKDKVKNSSSNFEKSVFRLKSKQGQYRWIEDISEIKYNSNENVTCVLGISRDITDRKNEELELIRLKNLDNLTKVNNRYFFDKIAKDFKGKSFPIGLFFIDVDRLKDVNDMFGHLEGDKLIRLVAEDLKRKIKDDGIISRYGGDEFIIIIKDKSLEELEKYYYKLKKQDIFFHGKNRSFSIGFSYSKNKKINIKNLISKADKNMYENKQKRIIYK